MNKLTKKILYVCFAAYYTCIIFNLAILGVLLCSDLITHVSNLNPEWTKEKMKTTCYLNCFENTLYYTPIENKKPTHCPFNFTISCNNNQSCFSERENNFTCYKIPNVKIEYALQKKIILEKDCAALFYIETNYTTSINFYTTLVLAFVIITTILIFLDMIVFFAWSFSVYSLEMKKNHFDTKFYSNCVLLVAYMITFVCLWFLEKDIVSIDLLIWATVLLPFTTSIPIILMIMKHKTTIK